MGDTVLEQLAHYIYCDLGTGKGVKRKRSLGAVIGITANGNIQNCLGDLPNLVTLNVTTWPKSGPGSNRLPRAVYEQLLQGLAQQGFEQSVAHAASVGRTSKLSIIAFGTSDKVFDRDNTENQIIFVKGKKVDPLGRESLIAVETGWCLRKYVDARSEVLDFPLSRTFRPPTGDGGDDSDDSDI